MRWKWFHRSLARLAVVLFILWAGLRLVVYCLDMPSRLLAHDSQIVEYRDGTAAHVFLSEDDKWRIAVTTNEVDPAYLSALFCLEDRRFYSHGGVDPWAVGRALAKNLVRGRVVSGASTLTMQLARILDPQPRSLSAKLRQTLLALKLEHTLSKRQILAAYLRYLPFGHNVEGIEAAALSYFGHRASALSGAEIAVLLAVPQDPIHRYPSPANSTLLRAAQAKVAARLLACGALPLGNGSGRIGPEELRRQIDQTPVPAQLLPFPRQAPHAAMWLRQQHPGEARLRTTLDRGAQKAAERTLAAGQREANSQGIFNAALVLVEQMRSDSPAEVRALVGNFDFWDHSHAGQVVAFSVPRSPGSALKPFLYALAIDRGLALPGFLVPDVPMEYGSYAPQNYEKDHAVLVRLSDALSRSLNLPFVHLLNSFGVERFISSLRQLGATSLRPEPGYYGLSAAIGGVEISPLELAGLYATLSNDGSSAPLRILRGIGSSADDRGSRTPSAVFSAEAAFLTRQALLRKDRPDFSDRQRMTGKAPQIYWKTGTSFGHRDAWAAGGDGQHTAVVWLGNLDHHPSTALVGSSAAGPFLFDVLAATHDAAGKSPEDSPPPALLRPVEVCAYSGQPPNADCPLTQKVLAPERSVPTAKCPYHVTLEVDEKTGLALTPLCRSRYSSRLRTFVVWPMQVQRWLGKGNAGLGVLPPYAPGCAANGPPPEITAPPLGQTILLVPGRPTEFQRVPFSGSSQHSSRLSWFVDGEFLGTFSTGERVYWRPSVGIHKVVATDDSGGSGTRTIEVRSIK